jgi:phosphate transport system substrate-binding protein
MRQPNAEWQLAKLASCCFLAALLLAGSGAPSTADTLTISGSTTFNAVVMVPHQKEIEAQTGHTLVVTPNRTELGVELLLEHHADLAMISTSLETVKHVLEKNQPDLPLGQLTEIEIQRQRVAFTVHPSNPVRSISGDKLRQLLLGEITNWKELGGRDLPIRIVMVDSGAGIPLAVATQLLQGKPVTTTNAIRVRIGSQTAKVVEQEPGAFGLTQANNVPGHNIVEVQTDRPVEQRLSYVSLGTPSGAVRSVIDATRKIVDTEQ